MKVYIRQNADYYSIVRYILKLIEKNRNCQFQYVNSIVDSDIIWDHEHPNTEIIATKFYESLKKENFSELSKNWFHFDTSIKTDDNKKDIVATIFYLVNCMQEFKPIASSLDSFGRFKYECSYQAKFNNMDENLVQNEINDFCQKWNIAAINKKSTFFISHDIDTIYGSFLQDGLWAVKKMKIGVILNLILWELSNKPYWKNIDRIIRINSEYDIRSTFFWLVNKGIGIQKIKNADYDIRKEQNLLNIVNDAKFINGLHKSCSDMSINEELNKGSLQTTFNRYHFLKFLPHTDFGKISESKLDFDCSLGFAEHYGFRNSYGKAFQPFDIENNKPYDFVEAPLHFMDGTFHKYMKISSKQIARVIIDFYEKNPLNCDFSLLWHNTYFTNYKYNSFLEEYKKVIEYIYENKIQCVTPSELIAENKLIW